MTPLKVHHSGVHEYLGMTMGLKKQGKVKIMMKEYATDLLDTAPEEFSGEAATTASAHLFKVNPKVEIPSPAQGATFHHLVEKCFFMCKIARPDTQIAVSFLCGRDKAPDVDDWKKIKRLFQYLRATINSFLP